ncbi:sensor domain-containing diguanylate cyclase [Acetivibrio clariflavus]|uniref:Diguanylate cyclase (GGDEF) domain-containing protein n=1 Tax=Acetivibrio clariflavus (strain DSM 19732 / NBRC 101661 / EBR45) TaxID=720554 RepID=G8LXT7_ACECE|nr:sensor domain-containing diguanylate cyclase [Acetivibrio clariflavus]AEV68840.1 diguanylate cyclase (GGDEF) domain-containing protein [Acetivibrio clariflavus DSM 19732]
MKRIKKYEQIYINLSWIFITMALCIEIICDFFYINNLQFHQKSVYRLVFIFALVLLNLLKQLAINRDLFTNNVLYWGLRALEIITITFSLRFLELGQLIYPFMFVIILLAACRRSKKDAFFIAVFIMVSDLIFSLLYCFIYQKSQLSIVEQGRLLINVIVYFLMFIFSIIYGSISADEIEKEKKNKELYSELENKIRQLETEQQEAKLQNEKLKETNYKVEEANKKLRESIAEYYTVQQITQAISSIFDVKELLKHVNDIIIGVMGVNNSTIVLYDEKKDRLRVHTTNVSNRDELIALFDNINCDALKDVLKSKKPLLENFVDSKEYPFTEDRNVSSLICVPLVTKTKNFGLVLVEHKYFNAFDEDNLRLLNIIGQQVSIALENAELYEKMHEMATVDNLTGVYNRLYFQERLQKEFENAQKEGYSLSLAIFDIDHFKRFNDTFGHLFGDKVLKDISNMLKNSLRSGDIIARYGGEEFVVLFPRTGLKEAYDKVESLREKIAKTVIRDELVTASVTVSFGLSSYPEISSTQSELLKMADNALYDAKASGRNCVKIANTDISSVVDSNV